MPAGRNFRGVFVFLTVVFVVSQPVAAALFDTGLKTRLFTSLSSKNEKPTQPSDLFPNFPVIRWGMTYADARKAIEDTGARAFRPVETELAWQSQFDEMDGRGALRFVSGSGLDEIVVQLYYSDRGREMYEGWLKKLTRNHGAALETGSSEDVTSKLWKFDDGFSLELRLVKSEGENRFMTDLHWVKSTTETPRTDQ